MVTKQSTANEMLEGESATHRAVKKMKKAAQKASPVEGVEVSKGMKHIRIITYKRCVIDSRPRYRDDQFEIESGIADELIAKDWAIETPKMG